MKSLKLLKLFLVVLVAVSLTSCGSKPYREYKKEMSRIKKELKKTESCSDLVALYSDYLAADNNLSKSILEVSNEEINELDKIDKEIETLFNEKEKELNCLNSEEYQEMLDHAYDVAHEAENAANQNDDSWGDDDEDDDDLDEGGEDSDGDDW